MARRATLLRSLRKEGGAVALLAGTEEFLRSTWMPDKLAPKTASAMARAYEAIGYDCVFLAPNEARLADLHFAGFPGNFVRLTPKVATRTIEVGGVKLGLVLFPTVSNNGGADPDTEAFQAVVDAAKQLRPSVDFVAGVSAWGSEPEERFLKQTEPALDVLLGSGPGSVRGRLVKSRRTFWVRSYSEGKGVMVLRFFERGDRKWTPGEDARLESIRLGDDIPAASDIAQLFESKE